MRLPAASFFAFALSLAMSGGRALAHPPPMGTGLWWIPATGAAAGGAAGERLVIRTPRGFLIGSAPPSSPGTSADTSTGSSAANDFGFLCNEAVGILDGETASFDTLAGDLFIATYGKGVVRAEANGCQWEPLAGVSTSPAFDVVTSDANAYVVGGSPHDGQHFWVGRDGGASWYALANSDVPYTRVRVARSDPSRVYVSGMDISAAGAPVHRLGVSDDGGQTIIDRPIALGPDDLQARVLAVDPLRADHVYVYVESNSAELPERLLLSDDAGRSFTIGPTLHDLQGFAQSDDGRHVWVGGKEGLVRSRDGGGSFAAAGAKLTNVTCLAFHAGRVYACGVLDNQLVVAASEDDGDTFHKVFSFDQVRKALDCPGTPATRAPVNVCAEALGHWRAELGTLDPPASGGGGFAVGGAGGRAEGGVSGAGGASATSPPISSASGCSVSGGGRLTAGDTVADRMVLRGGDSLGDHLAEGLAAVIAAVSLLGARRRARP